MCGRFHIAPEAQLEEIFSPMQLRSFEDQSVKFSGEIFPTDVVPVYIMENGCRLVKPLIWGFPKWDGKGVIFNARQESALEKTMFRDSLLKRRVAVPTSGFFEWTLAPGQKKKDRYLFTLPGEKVLFLAGLWNSFRDQVSGQMLEHFAILTTEANETVASFHDRMPVLLTNDEVDDWLIGYDFRKYLERNQLSVLADKKCKPIGDK